MRYRFSHLKDPTWNDLADCLKEAYLTSQIHHYRHMKGHSFPFSPDMMDIKVVTICCIEDDNRNLLARGFSFCECRDNFNRKIGRKIAQNRAEKVFENSSRKQFFEGHSFYGDYPKLVNDLKPPNPNDNL